MRVWIPSIALLALVACTNPNAGTKKDFDGRDCAHAIVVKTVAEEYQWIRTTFPGCRPMGQSLSSCEGFPVDILDIRLADGSTRKIYFNIKIVMEEERKMFSGK